MTLKATLKKTWAWLKHNWYVPAVIIYTLVLWLLFKDKAGALKVLQVRSESYEEQIRAIEATHKKEIEERDKILERYHTILGQLEKDYEEKKMVISKKKKEEIKRIVKEYNEKPDALAKVLAERYGLNYVE